MNRWRGGLAIAASIGVGVLCSVAVQWQAEIRARREFATTLEMTQSALVSPGLAAVALPAFVVADVRHPGAERSRGYGSVSVVPVIVGVVGVLATLVAPVLLVVAIWRRRFRLLIAGCASVVVSYAFSTVWVLEVLRPALAN